MTEDNRDEPTTTKRCIECGDKATTFKMEYGFARPVCDNCEAGKLRQSNHD